LLGRMLGYTLLLLDVRRGLWLLLGCVNVLLLIGDDGIGDSSGGNNFLGHGYAYIFCDDRSTGAGGGCVGCKALKLLLLNLALSIYLKGTNSPGVAEHFFNFKHWYGEDFMFTLYLNNMACLCPEDRNFLCLVIALHEGSHIHQTAFRFTHNRSSQKKLVYQIISQN
jgi:hypothetical protein